METTGRGLARGDRRRNARLAALRAVVRRELAIVAIDLAIAKQAVAVMDHDSVVLARKMFRCGPWRLDDALDWAETVALQAEQQGS